MPKNAKQRQQKLEAKNKRRNRRKLARARPFSPLDRIVKAAEWPIVSAQISSTLFEKGIGSVVLTRQSTGGTNAVAFFLIDTWCLGVKDAFVKYLRREQAIAMSGKIAGQMGQMKNVTPQYLRKLVLGSVEFGMSLGIKPAAEYGVCSRILDGIDESLCLDEIEFGKNGKPLFISGPYDSPLKIQRIMEAFSQSSGEGNFPGMLAAGSGDFGDSGFLVAGGERSALEWINEEEDFDDGVEVVEIGHGDLKNLIFRSRTG